MVTNLMVTVYCREMNSDVYWREVGYISLSLYMYVYRYVNLFLFLYIIFRSFNFFKFYGHWIKYCLYKFCVIVMYMYIHLRVCLVYMLTVFLNCNNYSYVHKLAVDIRHVHVNNLERLFFPMAV